MAQSKDNIVMKGASGTVGKMLVFRTTASDKTIIARRPKKTDRPASVEQQNVMDRFREAAYYAKNAILDPLMKAAYQAKTKPGQTAYNMAFADYLKKPELKMVSAMDYNGAIGETILLRIFDTLEVKSVKVNLLSATSQLIETGSAVQQQNGMDWVYTATTLNPTVAGTKIEVEIKDTPGNISLETAEL